MGDGITHSRPKTDPNFEVNDLRKKNVELRQEVEKYKDRWLEETKTSSELRKYKFAYELLLKELRG